MCIVNLIISILTLIEPEIVLGNNYKKSNQLTYFMVLSIYLPNVLSEIYLNNFLKSIKTEISFDLV